MKAWITGGIGLALVLAGWTAVPAAAGAQTVGYVTMNRILEDSPQAEQAMRELEEEFSPRDSELVAEREELQRMRDRLEREGDMMDPSDRAALEREFSARSREFRRAQESFSEDLNVRRNEELSRLQRRINDAIAELARERDIDVILTERNVLYASDRVDITDDVLAAMQSD